MKKSRIFVLLFSLFLGITNTLFSQINIIPQPNNIEFGMGSSYKLSQPAELLFNGVGKKSKKQFADYLVGAGFSISSHKKSSVKIQLKLVDKLIHTTSFEGYTLDVTSEGIIITSLSETGLFYGIQSLIQLVTDASNIPLVHITDSPRFPYRGVHIDVSRHFYSMAFIKKHLDMMAHLKINRFHWHLTDGAGWRLEIKKYPLLTKEAAWRKQARWKDWWATNPREYVNMDSGVKAYGGFYTQKEAREIVKYAAERHITVIPEIEMPAHSEEVLAVYPHLSCAGKSYVQSEFCVGNEQTFEFLQNVLKEVIKIFPSEYIHIGGDEADKSSWKKCPKCQARMKAEGLQDENELQSYMIQRIEKFLAKNKRKLIGWDEIAGGGLSSNATIMYWRGLAEEGESARSINFAIMTPGEFMYFDSYQANPANEPEAIGGFLPLKKVYSYDPAPKTLTLPEIKNTLGVQSNLWTEYIPTENDADRMLYPRALALSEVAWTNPENKNWEDFKRRVDIMIPYLKAHGINTFTLSNEVSYKHYVDSIAKSLRVELSTEKYGVDIRYTTNGTDPNLQSPLYKVPLYVSDSMVITSQLFIKEQAIAYPSSQRFDYHKAVGKKVTYNIAMNKNYMANGEKTLVDAEKGGYTHGDKRWQGFVDDGMDITIDLGETTEIESIKGHFLQSKGAWIYFPKEVIISVSDDNQSFTELARIQSSNFIDPSEIPTQNFDWLGKSAGRYIRYKAVSNGIKGGWVFLDEIVVW